MIKKGNLVQHMGTRHNTEHGLGVVLNTNWKSNGVSTGLIEVYWQKSGKKWQHQPYDLVNQNEIEER